MTHIGYNTDKLDVSSIPEGSYLMQIKTGKEILTKVIVIVRNE
jgi:hypothetical protein